MPITIYPGSMKKRNANGSYSDLVPAIATDPEVLDDFAEEYSISETYNIGDYCIHNSDLYKCNTNNITGAWNNNAWDRVTVADELVDHKNTLNQLNGAKAAIVDLTNISQTSPNCTVTNGIANGTYFYLDGVLTRATASIAENAPFTSSNCETVTAGGLNELNSNIAKYKTKTVSGTTQDTGSISTELSVDNYIMGHKMNNSANLEIKGYVAYNGIWYIQTASNNTSVDMTVIYKEP